MHWIRRVAGLAIAFLAIVPLYRWLPSRETGLAGRSTVEIVALQSDLLWTGFLVIAMLALLAGMIVRPSLADRLEERVHRALARIPLPWFAVTAGALSTAVTAVVAGAVFERRPNLVDALLQLTHARYLAAGALGGPSEFSMGFWHVQNALVSESGWYSQYPPGHIALLAAGLALGAAWLVGPVIMGATVALSVLTLARLLPGRQTTIRIAGLALAVNPFLVAHAASFMNHSTAALLGVAAVYCALRSTAGGSAAWAAMAGVAVAAGTMARPMSAVVAMLVVIAVWRSSDDTRGQFVRRGAWAMAGGLPLVALHLWYNRIAFGGLTTFGYDAAWGPSHGLGFHPDPWGNAYGPLEALLYTSADLTALNLNLLETLLPHVALVGVFLAVVPRLATGERILALWAVLPLATNALYWHHGQFMGPRMLAEFAPAWTGLAVVAIARLVELLPRERVLRDRIAPRVTAAAIVAAGAVALLVLGPQRLRSYGGEWLPVFRRPAPAAPPQSIVFVHGAWESRLFSRVAALGVRLDGVETAMRQNPTCLVQQHLDAAASDRRQFGAAREGLPALDLASRAFEYQPAVLFPDGARVRVDTTIAMPPRCLRELRADRFGTVDASFLWSGDLPGIESGQPLFARDLGPAMNERLLARYPDRSAYLYARFTPDDTARLLPYAEGRALLWSTQP